MPHESSRLRLRVPVAGSAVGYMAAGDGRPLVLLHGGGADAAELTWGPLLPRLAARTAVIAPDLPGFGDTPLGEVAPTLVGYRDWLVAFLDALRVDRCVFAGLSLGGGIALAAALAAPERIAGLALCGPYGLDPAVPGGRWGWLSVHIPGVGAASWWLLGRSRALVRASLRAMLRREGAVTDDLVDAVTALVRRPGAGAAWRALQRGEVGWSGPRTVFGAALERIACPAVLLAASTTSCGPPWWRPPRRGCRTPCSSRCPARATSCRPTRRTTCWRRCSGCSTGSAGERAARDRARQAHGAGLAVAARVAVVCALGYVLFTPLTGLGMRTRDGWLGLLLGVFLVNGVAEEVAWRACVFGALRRGRSFWRAVLLSMPLIALTHVCIALSSGLLVGIAATLVFSLSVSALALVVPLLAFPLGRPARRLAAR